MHVELNSCSQALPIGTAEREIRLLTRKDGVRVRSGGNACGRASANVQLEKLKASFDSVKEEGCAEN